MLSGIEYYAGQLFRARVWSNVTWFSAGGTYGEVHLRRSSECVLKWPVQAIWIQVLPSYARGVFRQQGMLI